MRNSAARTFYGSFEKASQSGNFIRIDMEDASLTDKTLEILEWAHAEWLPKGRNSHSNPTCTEARRMFGNCCNQQQKSAW